MTSYAETVAKHAGSLFKHTGDGVCVVFSSPRSAVDAAVTAQRALELPVRMGIATGEAEHRGDDYFGSVLNRAASVMAAGHGGQILLDGDHCWRSLAGRRPARPRAQTTARYHQADQRLSGLRR